MSKLQRIFIQSLHTSGASSILKSQCYFLQLVLQHPESSLCEIWGYHGGSYEDCLLGCGATCNVRSENKFTWCIIS